LQPFPNLIPKTNKDHYISFNEIYGKDTSETYQPSTIQKVDTSTISSTANDLSINSMGFKKKNLLKNFIETIDYTCSTTFYGISDFSEPSPAPFLNDNNCNVTKNSEVLQDESPKKQNINSNASLKLLFRHCSNAEILSSTPASKQLYCSECYFTVKTKKKGKGVKFKSKKKPRKTS
ncbi:16367_t:CDS:2, partial [Gigaspora rosea]